MNRVLVVSYHFPPSGGSKTRRTLKILKYLPQLRWLPVVLTTKFGTGFGFDSSLLALVPEEASVHRAFDISAWVKAVLPVSARGKRVDRTGRRANGNHAMTCFARLCRQVFSRVGKWTAIPDTYGFLWGPFAVYTGFRAITREDVKVIYSTGPPFSNHIVGVLLKKMTKRPLVLDFRDAWTADPLRRMKYPAPRHSVEILLEKFVITNADMVLSTTEGITGDFRARYGAGCEEKFITLPNGYDREDFSIPIVRQKERRHTMRIVHTGHLRLERSPKSLLIALRQLFDENPRYEHELEVYLIGESQAFLDGKKINDYLEDFNLWTSVKLIDHVPQAEAIRYQMSADILLLLIGAVPAQEASTYGIASKVFDYMIAAKPVLTLADPGPVRELVERTQIGPAFALSDIDGIKQFLAGALAAFKRGQLEVASNKREIDRYDFRNLTAQLVEKFHTVSQRMP